jgi:hypothetical protein
MSTATLQRQGEPQTADLIIHRLQQIGGVGLSQRRPQPTTILLT